MLKKLRDILNYYDSEPIEILLGIIWLVFFPVICFYQLGIQIIFTIISILLGSAMLKASCSGSLSTRKTLSYGSFLFSILVIVLLFLNNSILYSSNLLWLFPVLMSFINLSAVTSQYYRNKKL